MNLIIAFRDDYIQTTKTKTKIWQQIEHLTIEAFFCHHIPSRDTKFYSPITDTYSDITGPLE